MIDLDQIRKTKFSTIFETAGRFTINGSAGSTNTWTALGADLSTGGAIPGFIQVNADVALPAFAVFSNSPQFYGAFWCKAIAAKGEYYYGMGTITTTAAGHGGYKDNHIGFKVVVDAGGIATLSATQADGATENTRALVIVVQNDVIEVYADVHGGQNGVVKSVDYYYRLNGGTWSLPLRLTSNVPSGAGLASSTWLQVSASNANNSLNQEIIATVATYQR